jgi:hypothetical protein
MKNEPERFAVWHGLFLGESCALFIALATTIVPSKTGSKTGISGHFFKEPTFIQEFWVNLVFINVILVLLAGCRNRRLVVEDWLKPVLHTEE